MPRDSTTAVAPRATSSSTSAGWMPGECLVPVSAQSQARPPPAVWVHGKVYSTTSPGARKGRNLQARPECSMAARAPALDIVVEGATSWIEDRDLLEQIASAYDSNYGWPVTITEENMFDAPYGAPTAGPPP